MDVDKGTGVRTDQDNFSILVKPEYVLDARAPSLAPIQDTDGAIPNSEMTPKDDRDKPRDQNSKKGKRGRNKKRPRDVRIDNADKICLAVMRGEVCQFGAEKCRFGHDLKAFLAIRPDDIAVEGMKTCPNYERNGTCPFGIMCRFGASHINMATGQNLGDARVDAGALAAKKASPVVNLLSSDLQTQLRKNTYPFICQRKNKSTLGPEGNDGYKIDTKNDVLASDNNSSKDVVDHPFLTTENGASSGAHVPLEEKTYNVIISDKDEPTDRPLNQENPEDTSLLSSVNEVKDDPSSQETYKQADDASKNASVKSPPLSSFLPYPAKTRKIIDFSNKVYVAPLTTVGNLPFRRVMKRFGADITCGEMALATNLLEGKPSEWALLKRHEDEDVFGIQLAAGYPDVFTRTMELVESQVSVDFVDLNLGCPLDMVCSKGSGAALMMRDKRLKDCLTGITGTLTKCQITIKMRTGWDEKIPFAHELVPKIQSWGFGESIGAVMIHGRSRLQRYSKEANWSYISQVANSQNEVFERIPIIGNGDILSFTDYEEKVLQSQGVIPCAMLGRGALIKPWLPTEIKERRHWDISACERFDFLRDFVRFGLQHWGSDQQGVNNCRRFLLEWLSFLHRYVPVGLLEQTQPQRMNQRPPKFLCGRNDLETLLMSSHSSDWIKISELLLGPIPDGFHFEPKHKANSYQ